ncbi:MAG: hypothetical protein QNL62_12005 [Gammaproteobacteria bacterium]|nr:hypothetical protein [Gammaproteobacteria bacterium]
MDNEKNLHNYTHVLANLLRGGKHGALSELYTAIVLDLKENKIPEQDELLLLLETMGKPEMPDSKVSDKQQVMELVKAIMILLEQDSFYQGVKSYHLNLMKRAPVNALERRLKTRNFTDVFSLLNKKYN